MTKTSKENFVITKYYPELKPVKTHLIEFDPLLVEEINTTLNKRMQKRKETFIGDDEHDLFR